MTPRDRARIDALEPELRAMRARTIARRRLAPAVSIVLAALRVYVILAVALVAVTFVRALHR